MPLFSLTTGLGPTQPRPKPPAPLRLLAWVLRRLSVAVAIVAVQQRRGLRRLHRVEWMLEGHCRSCGSCCENLLLPLGPNVKLWAPVRRFWHEVVYDFFPRAFEVESDGQLYASYGCRNFTADRRCSRYSLRPLACRTYPALALLQPPTPHAHCGYQLVQLPSRGSAKR